MHIDHPFHFDPSGAAAATTDDDHLCDLLEQVLLTRPGERINRPDFGCGLLHQVFEPNSPEIAAAIKYTTMAAIQRWLGDVIEPQDIDVQADDATLAVLVRFVVRRTGDLREAKFQWGATS